MNELPGPGEPRKKWGNQIAKINLLNFTSRIFSLF